ncbi:MAG: PilX N-terminal domain-containing pilus assembly protein [Nitrospiraceae bacterium]
MGRHPDVNDRGFALLAVLMLVCILSLLGMTSLQLATQEMTGTRALQEEHTAHHAAEAAVGMVMEWFHDPAAALQGPEARLLSKQLVDGYGQPAFVDAHGVSQFRGTADRPDILFDASIPQHDQLLNDAATGWFRSLQGMARILKLQVYGPVRPGLLCTVEVVAAAGQRGHIKKTVAVEFGTYSIPPLRAAIQTAGIGASLPPASSSSILVHWGDLKSGGNVRLISQQDVPEKTSQASVSGQPYGEMSYPQDRWFDMWVGGEVIFDRPQSWETQTLPGNLHVNQNPMPGLKMDQWQYETLKRMAIQFGSYYGLDRDGRLHPGGVIHPGEGVAADEVLSARGVGDHHGLVFIDTLDQQPPRIDNLGTLKLNGEYLEGMFVMNAHVIWNPTSSTKFVPALSPPPEEQQSMGLRIPVQLSAINLRGVLYTAGDLVYCGRPRVYGGIMTEGALSSCTDQHALLEVWYDHDLGEGLHRGVPIVYVAPGTWHAKL